MKRKTVLLGMSGGVDSSVAALLLKKQGYEVIGAFMINFSDKSKLTGECNWVEDRNDANRIAAILEIPLITLNFEKEYRKQVLEPMFDSYKKGLTPNPDSFCNTLIKFPLLWKEAERLGADYIATGHYAKITRKKSGFELSRPKDKNKDQTYFLYDLSQKDLSHTIFPLSNLTKEEVRTIAKKNRFPNFDKQGSRGICFVGKTNIKSFLQQKIKIKKGKILSPEGKEIGSHQGVMFYTIGEKIRPTIGTEIVKGSMSDKRWYVAKKKIRSNTIVAAPEGHPTLLKDTFAIKSIHWILDSPKFPLKCKVRIRHLGELMDAIIIKKTNNYICKLKKSITSVAEGQSAVIYSKNRVLGGGIIADS